jgi:hypothetical protein
MLVVFVFVFEQGLSLLHEMPLQHRVAQGEVQSIKRILMNLIRCSTALYALQQKTSLCAAMCYQSAATGNHGNHR